MNTIRRMASPVMDRTQRDGPLYCPASCTLDVNEKFRFTLERRWERTVGYARIACFVMLNPSTADALKNDATIRRLIGFCKGWSLAGFDVFNLFALRATDPKKLAGPYAHGLGITPDQIVNNNYLLDAAHRPYALTAFAWGAGLPKGSSRDFSVVNFWAGAKNKPMMFGATKAGHPLHPLRLSAAAKLYPYVARKE